MKERRRLRHGSGTALQQQLAGVEEANKAAHRPGKGETSRSKSTWSVRSRKENMGIMAADTSTRNDAFASLSRDGQPGQKTMATPPPTPPELLPASSDAMRLSMLAPTRLLLGSLASTMIGFMLGGFQGGQMAQLRFRAEHAHKMPDTTTGWYFYHKTKNYHAMQGGIREGFRMGAKTGFWSFAALSLETTVDRMRGCSDMLSTIVATVSVAGMFSLTRKRFFSWRVLVVSGSTGFPFFLHISFPFSVVTLPLFPPLPRKSHFLSCVANLTRRKKPGVETSVCLSVLRGLHLCCYKAKKNPGDLPWTGASEDTLK